MLDNTRVYSCIIDIIYNSNFLQICRSICAEYALL